MIAPSDEGWVGNWSPGIGDPSIVGWFTVVAYFAAAYLCFRARRRVPAAPARFWKLIALVLVALGINKQLDVQSLLTELARISAHEQGWYEERRAVQRAFILGVAAVAACAAALLALSVYRQGRPARVAAAGMAFICGYVVIRAASFHHVDQLIGSSIVGVRLNWLFELTGIGVVAVGASGVRAPAPQRRMVATRSARS